MCQVDNLDDIDHLKEYISQTSILSFFMSRGYFCSRACQSEIRQTFEAERPFMLVHEVSAQKGGAPLDVLRQECPELLEDGMPVRSVVFDGREIIRWHRVRDFQIHALTRVSANIVRACSAASGVEASLYVPGAATIRPLVAQRRSVVQASPPEPAQEPPDYL